MLTVQSTTVLIALFFFAMGVYALLVPDRVLEIFGVRVATVDGRNEVRAVYGGYGVAMSAVLLLTLGVPAIRPGVLVCVAVALCGMAGGRLVAALVDRSPGFYPWLFCAIETLMAAALFAAVETRSW